MRSTRWLVNFLSSISVDYHSVNRFVLCWLISTDRSMLVVDLLELHKSGFNRPVASFWYGWQRRNDKNDWDLWWRWPDRTGCIRFEPHCCAMRMELAQDFIIGLFALAKRKNWKKIMVISAPATLQLTHRNVYSLCQSVIYLLCFLTWLFIAITTRAATLQNSNNNNSINYRVRHSSSED